MKINAISFVRHWEFSPTLNNICYMFSALLELL